MINEGGYVRPDTLDMQIEVLVKNTLDRSVKKHGYKFVDDHHAYAVIKEEVEEVGEELESLNTCLKHAWRRIREDGSPKNYISTARCVSIKLITEALQVAAMCDKYKNSIKQNKDEEKVCGVNGAPCCECKPVCGNTEVQK